jgi:hypothetical protein
MTKNRFLILLLLCNLILAACREHQVVEVIVDPLEPKHGELVYMIIGQAGDTSYRRELGLILRDSNSIVLRNHHLHSTDGLSITLMENVTSPSLTPHQALLQHYGRYYSNNGMSRGGLTLTEADRENFAASGDFDFRLGNGASGDSITIVGSFKSIDYLEMNGRVAPSSAIDSFSLNFAHDGYYFLTKDSLTFTAALFDEDPSTPHTIWYRVMVHKPMVLAYDLGDTTMARVEIHRFTNFGGTDQYSENLDSGPDDVLEITEFDRDQRKLSGTFIVAGRKGTFKDVTWNVIGYR